MGRQTSNQDAAVVADLESSKRALRGPSLSQSISEPTSRNCIQPTFESLEMIQQLSNKFDSLMNDARKTPPLQLPQTQNTDPTSEQQQSIQAVSDSLEEAAPWEILKWTADQFGDKFTVATAFGAEGMLIIHWLSQVAPQTRIFNLDTGYQFPETLAMVDRIKQRYGLEIELVQPELNVQQYEQLHKGPVYTNNPDQCCQDRKLTPLKRRLAGAQAWASAIRRDQSPDRALAPIVGWDRKFKLIKVSPLANWTKKQVWKTIMDEKVPYNPLHDQGYPSVGCMPCTRCVLAGEDERAGRWSGSKKTECGLHTWS